MTRSQLFAAFPRPWGIRDSDPGAVFDATGAEVLQVDSIGQRGNPDVVALAHLVAELANGAGE